jgi:carboxylesterase type B
VPTSSGAVCGVKSAGTLAFLGIPYAESTVGAKRWTTSVPKAAWTGVYPATAFGKECTQNSFTPRPLEQSEDCLSLNVWTPEARGGARLPVLVFIHGGAFVIGSSSSGDVAPSDPTQALYDGAYLAQSQKIVVVTLNYRIGALGFLAGVAACRAITGCKTSGRRRALRVLGRVWLRARLSETVTL